MSASQQVIELPHLRLAARVWGPEDGAPVLALHGWLDNASTFERLAPRLPGCRIVAVDLPGHGRSDHRAHPTYYLLDYVADALAATAALGWSRFNLLGHSLGASVAALAAGTFPERVERLALIEGLGPLAEEPEGAPQRLRGALERELRGVSREPRTYASVDEAAAARHRATGLPLDAARLIVDRALEEVDGRWRWRTDPRLRWPSRLRLSETQICAFLGAITCPARLVVADRGWSVDPELAAARQACVRDLEIVRLSGGHHVHLEDPDAVAAAFAPFLGAPPSPAH
ncbi:MAG: alpha/beta hydrolase [Nannocystaceae bacterium]